MLNHLVGRTRPSAMPVNEAPRRSLAVLQRQLRWRRWRVRRPQEPELLTSAELAECTCPDLCQRDHGND